MLNVVSDHENDGYCRRENQVLRDSLERHHMQELYVSIGEMGKGIRGMTCTDRFGIEEELESRNEAMDFHGMVEELGFHGTKRGLRVQGMKFREIMEDLMVHGKVME